MTGPQFQETPEGRIAAMEFIAERSRAGSLMAFQTLVRFQMAYEDGSMSDEDRVAYETFRDSEVARG